MNYVPVRCILSSSGKISSVIYLYIMLLVLKIFHVLKRKRVMSKNYNGEKRRFRIGKKVRRGSCWDFSKVTVKLDYCLYCADDCDEPVIVDVTWLRTGYHRRCRHPEPDVVFITLLFTVVLSFIIGDLYITRLQLILRRCYGDDKIIHFFVTKLFFYVLCYQWVLFL